MTPKFDYSTPSNPEDIQQLGYILDQCFVEPGESENYFNRIGDYNLRVIRRSGQIVGGLAIIPMGQWWGGLLVPMMGIAGVGIAPECRGSGAAIALMQDTLKELHSKGVPISVLYPATQRLYRKVGYEQAGTICGWEIPTDSIQILKQPLSMKAVPVDSEVFRELYLHQARLNNGNLDRHSSLWIPVISTDKDEKIYAYLIGTVDQPQGYIIFSQKRSETSNYIQVKDWVALTTAAVQTFWAFLASHRSQIDKVRWKGSAIDSLTLLLLEQTVKPQYVER
jgi:predicted acetyltransferase